MRDDRLGRGRAFAGTLDGRPGDGRQRRRPGRSGGAARHLAGCRGVHRLRGAASRARLAHGAVRRLRARLLPPRKLRCRARVPRHHRSGSRGLGKGKSGVSPALHIALPTRGDAGAGELVQRVVPQDHLAGDGSAAHGSASEYQRHRSSGPGAGADAGHSRARGQRGPGFGRTLPRLGHSRRAVRRAAREEPCPSRGRAGVAAVSGRGAGVSRRRRPSQRRRRRVRCALQTRARGAGADQRGTGERGDRHAAGHQRKNST